MRWMEEIQLRDGAIKELRGEIARLHDIINNLKPIAMHRERVT